MGPEGAAIIANGLKRNRTLTRLNLSTCEIGPEGGKAVAEAIKEHRTLQELDLHYNMLGVAGFALAEALVLSPIRTVDVSFNDLSLECHLHVEAAMILPAEVWRTSDLAAALKLTRELKLRFSDEVLQLAKVYGVAMRTFLGAVAHHWTSQQASDGHRGIHGPGADRRTLNESTANLLASLHAALVVSGASAPPSTPAVFGHMSSITSTTSNKGVAATETKDVFDAEKLQRLAHVYIPKDRTELLKLNADKDLILAEGRMLVLNTMPFEVRLGTTCVASRSWEAMLAPGRSPMSLMQRRLSRVGNAPMPVGNSTLDFSRPSTTASSRKVSTPRTPMHANMCESRSPSPSPSPRPAPPPPIVTRSISWSQADCIRIDLYLEGTTETKYRSWLPVLTDIVINIDQGVGEKRYSLQDAGELRVMFSLKKCQQHMANMLTLVWSAPPALRGVPLIDLDEYWERQALHNQNLRQRLKSEKPNMYEVVSKVVKPSTAAAQSSLAELLNFGPVDTFVSHFWGSAFEGMLKALDMHCRQKSDTRFWICSVANNQYRIEQELGAEIDNSPFAQALRSSTCTAMALMLDDGCETLRRIWCLYEIMTVILLQDSKPTFNLDFCTPSGVLNRGDLQQGAIEIANQVGDIDVAQANCSNARDKTMIDEAIVQRLGGHREMNERVRHAVDLGLIKTAQMFDCQIFSARKTLAMKTTRSSANVDDDGDGIDCPDDLPPRRKSDGIESMHAQNHRLLKENSDLRAEMAMMQEALEGKEEKLTEIKKELRQAKIQPKSAALAARIVGRWH